jgi:hypothetical protein
MRTHHRDERFNAHFFAQDQVGQRRVKRTTQICDDLNLSDDAQAREAWAFSFIAHQSLREEF